VLLNGVVMSFEKWLHGWIYGCCTIDLVGGREHSVCCGLSFRSIAMELV